MIRTAQISITEANTCKLLLLDSIFIESKKVVNLYIDELWKRKDFLSKFTNFKVNTWLSSRLQQCLGKQALGIIRSQRKKKKLHKPFFKKDVINFDPRFIDIQYDNNSFDIWFKLSSIGNKICLKLPGKKHKHFHKYDSWNVKKSYTLRKIGKRYFVDMIFEKEAPEFKLSGKEIGIDQGYNKLIATSECEKLDTGLKQIYNKISNKKQGSKAFKKALIERDNKINESVNLIPFEEIKTIVVEDLKNVKYKSKFKKDVNNKLQRWSYSKVLKMLSLRCEEFGIFLKKINPAYTSQTCSSCGFIHRNNRCREEFLCLKCGIDLDADYNAAKNILHRGVYSLSTI